MHVYTSAVAEIFHNFGGSEEMPYCLKNGSKHALLWSGHQGHQFSVCNSWLWGMLKEHKLSLKPRFVSDLPRHICKVIIGSQQTCVCL